MAGREGLAHMRGVLYNFEAADIISIPVGPLETNCYIVWDKNSLDGFIIDPGSDFDIIEGEARRLNLRISAIVNTHGHFDHVGANGTLKDAFKTKVAIHGADMEILANAQWQAGGFGIEMDDQPAPDMILGDGDELKAGAVALKVLHTPGHTPGGVCLYMQKEGVVFTGDTLFAGGVGRTDFPGGSFEELQASIKKKLVPLPGGVLVLPGHGDASTIEEEKRSNPFLKELL